MKKVCSYLVLLALASSVLVGCKGGDDDSTAKPNPPPVNDKQMPKNQMKPLQPSAD